MSSALDDYEKRMQEFQKWWKAREEARSNHINLPENPTVHERTVVDKLTEINALKRIKKAGGDGPITIKEDYENAVVIIEASVTKYQRSFFNDKNSSTLIPEMKKIAEELTKKGVKCEYGFTTRPPIGQFYPVVTELKCPLPPR